ncbi:hypothetical protein AVEN_254428-1 [Araneus ventricosus]|uniref:Uncharacterized protein n=1 Tax=Araneus ventricosus TaxID=182803 RepID=A0A4Y2PD30_ARAVE|nr:hypothetical protein AVEN_254428-1 [Araneus ventricosus]
MDGGVPGPPHYLENAVGRQFWAPNISVREPNKKNSNWRPLFEFKIAGTPKRYTREGKNDSATVSAHISLRGLSSGHLENRSRIVRH